MKLQRLSIATLGLLIFTFYAMPSAHAQFGDFIKKGKEKINQSNTSVETQAKESNTSQPAAQARSSNGNDGQSTQAVEPTAPANDPTGPADGTSSGVQSGNSRVVNGYEVPTNPNRIVFSKSPISATDGAARQNTLRRFVAGEPIYALANMNAQLDPTSSWSVALFVNDKQLVGEYLDERSRGNHAGRVVPIEIAPATPADTKNAFISYMMVTALNSLPPGLHKVWLIVNVPKSTIEQPNSAEGIFYVDTRKGSYATQLAALKRAAAPEVERRRGIDERAAREAKANNNRPASSNNSGSNAQQPGMPPTGFDPNVRIKNSCSEQRTLYFDNGSSPTLGGNSSTHMRLKPGTRIYVLDEQGNKTEIYTVGSREDQDVTICG
jgi:Sec-independent protein translocase protein TatA